MEETKFIFSGGLAFSEERDMMKLSAYAKKGWALESFAPLGYKLRRSDPQNIIYSIDYQKGADDEYFEFFEAAEWKHVCSIGNEIHVFSAPEGTKPIYSDKSTEIEKYEREKKQMGKSALAFLIFTVLFILLKVMSLTGWLPRAAGIISLILGIVSLIILVFSGLPYLAYQYRLSQLRKL